MERSHLIITDSGGVQEEAPSLGKPILVMRDTTERPEAVEAGFGHLVGSDYNAIVDGVRELTSSNERKLLARPNPFGAGNAGERIADELSARTQTVVTEPAIAA